MEVALVPASLSPFQPPRIHRRITMQNVPRRSNLFILSVLSTDKNMSDTLDLKQTIYNDSWFDHLAINHLSRSLQAAAGLKSKESGYDGLVEAVRLVSRRFSVSEQKVIVIQSLLRAVPRPILSLIKKLLPQTKFTREFCAIFTTIFFSWLVGPCQVKVSEVDGKIEKNVVYIQRCRLLEATNCVGMCTNLCKMPSQAFIKDSLGMPVNMVPNFEDMSCEMTFGQEAPPQEIDPAFAQPCYKQCNAGARRRTSTAVYAPVDDYNSWIQQRTLKFKAVLCSSHDQSVG